ncbi:MAG: DUF1992 domain-containing protein, partial [Actinomycetes bacterium]
PPVLPTPLSLRREVERLAETLAGERDERVVREIAEDLNARVREYYRRPEPGPLIVVRTVNVEQVVADWRSRQLGGPEVS